MDSFRHTICLFCMSQCLCNVALAALGCFSASHFEIGGGSTQLIVMIMDKCC